MLSVLVALPLIALTTPALGGTGSATGAPFVTVCGTGLCLGGAPFVVKGATAYGQYSNPAGEVRLAEQSHLDVLELVEFDTEYHVLSDTESSATWDRVDAFVAAAGKAGLHVILNLSEYGQSLAAAGQDPTTVDWRQYLDFVANRVNTVTGIPYKDDPTIAMVELYGEIDAPNYGVPTAGTTLQMQRFFQRSLREWHDVAPNILASTGGFSYLNDPNSGIPWQKIMSDRNDATCDVEVNSTPDRDISVPAVSSYCQKLGKPWFLAAWSSCMGSPSFIGDLDSWLTDSAMAAHAEDMVAVSANDHPSAPGPAMAAVGSDFWNLAGTPATPGTCDIGPQFPRTFVALATGS